MLVYDPSGNIIEISRNEFITDKEFYSKIIKSKFNKNIVKEENSIDNIMFAIDLNNENTSACKSK